MSGKIGPNWKQNVRKRVQRKARKSIFLLMDRQKGKCYWCEEDLVIVDVVRDRIVRITPNFVEWKDGEQVIRQKYATVDHVVPIREDHNNSPDNLVASCSSCNRDRTDQRSKTARKFCQCGKRKQADCDLCKRCREKAVSDYLISHGWEYNSELDRWRRPGVGTLHDVKFAKWLQGKIEAGEKSS